MKATVTLNGTSENPYHKMGLKQNPFPQIGEHQWDGFDRLLNNLEAEPIRDVAHLRERLKGCSEEFIEMCVMQFKPGETVKFDIEFMEGTKPR